MLVLPGNQSTVHEIRDALSSVSIFWICDRKHVRSYVVGSAAWRRGRAVRLLFLGGGNVTGGILHGICLGGLELGLLTSLSDL
jgi:hypothetical protein